MEVNFKYDTCACMDTVLQEVRSMELTQEIKLSDSMPDVGRVISAWGQAILRGKEWRADSVSVSGGLMVWVLYAPEDGSPERCLDAWIPFQIQWELPEDLPDGEIRVRMLVRFVDGRSVSARKIMVRGGVSALAEAVVPKELQTSVPEQIPEGVELLRSVYPVRLTKEAGERAFTLEEDLTMPDSAPKPDQILYYRMDPKLTDKKLLAGKLVFRGSGNLHMLCRSEEGKLFSWDFDLPFSQYAELKGEYGTDGQADIAFSPTSMELDLDEEGQLQFKGGLAAQYMISDKDLLQVVEDAYSPGREVTIHTENLEIPVILENRRENLYGEQIIAADASLTPDVTFLPDFPRQRRGENGIELTIPGTFQVLHYGEDGTLRSANSRWEGTQRLNADEDSQILAIPQASQPQAVAGGNQIQAKTELPLDVTATTRQRLPMITGVEVGEKLPLDPNRPSLILRRAGESRLWDIAKDSGSTMDAIRRANGIQAEPAPDQMLLIPVP